MLELPVLPPFPELIDSASPTNLITAGCRLFIAASVPHCRFTRSTDSYQNSRDSFAICQI